MPVDLKTIQTTQDASLRAKLSDDRGVQRAIARLRETFAGFGFGARRRLLSGALRLTRSMAPDVADALAACRETMGYTHPVEVFVRPEPFFNAFCMKDPSDHVVIAISSHLLESFAPNELQFVLGHELGHAAYDHFGIPMPNTAIIRDLAGTMVSRPVALELYVWCRAAELSADRIGLLSTRDPEAAAHSFFKLASGLAAPRVKSDLEAFAKQVESLAAAPEARSEPRDDDDTLDSFCTHPYNPVRVRALLAFSKSKLFQRSLGRPETGIDDADLDAILQRDLMLMEPSYLEEKSVRSELMRNLLYNSGILVSAANGKIEESEVNALRALLGEMVSEDTSRIDLENIRRKLGEQLQEAVRDVPFAERVRLLQHLTIIAGADGHVEEVEMAEMVKVAAGLQIPTTVIDQTLAGAEAPMD
ncbi:MAG TPA: M48 family metallopeptidase [Myxococcota bacterium]|nr:M48 family metallopeptidase [Myxococcota bacterium]HRY92512.1 M48 family metallopeptidase [Myxococcota bacterium]